MFTQCGPQMIGVHGQKSTAMQPVLIPLPVPLAVANSQATSSSICTFMGSVMIAESLH